MFNLFKSSRKGETVPAVTFTAPTGADYTLAEDQEVAFNALVADNEGFVNIDDVTHGLMNQQSQYITRYMDGSNPTVPVLVEGLRIDVSSSTYHEYRIHRDDVREFVARVKAHRKF